MNKELLIDIRPSSFPSFMLGMFAIGYIYKSRMIKIMRFAKSVDTSNNIFSSIRSYCNDSFHMSGILFFCSFVSFASFAKFDASFWLSYTFASCFAHFSASLSRMAFPQKWIRCTLGCNNTQFFAGFRGKFLSQIRSWFAAISIANLFSCGLRNFSAKARTSGGGKVKTLFNSLQFIKPILLTLDQERRKNQFDDFECEGLFSILIPRSLQIGIRVIVATKCFTVFLPSPFQVDSTANVEFSSGCTGDAVNARCFRQGLIRMIQWGHSYSLRQGYSLGFAGATNTCKTDQLDLHYTPSIRFPSSFMPIWMEDCLVLS